MGTLQVSLVPKEIVTYEPVVKTSGLPREGDSLVIPRDQISPSKNDSDFASKMCFMKKFTSALV